MAYLFLFCAIFAEVLATSLLKSTEGFTRLWPTLACVVGYTVSFRSEEHTSELQSPC